MFGQEFDSPRLHSGHSSFSEGDPSPAVASAKAGFAFHNSYHSRAGYGGRSPLVPGSRDFVAHINKNASDRKKCTRRQ